LQYMVEWAPAVIRDINRDAKVQYKRQSEIAQSRIVPHFGPVPNSPVPTQQQVET